MPGLKMSAIDSYLGPKKQENLPPDEQSAYFSPVKETVIPDEQSKHIPLEDEIELPEEQTAYIKPVNETSAISEYDHIQPNVLNGEETYNDPTTRSRIDIPHILHAKGIDVYPVLSEMLDQGANEDDLRSWLINATEADMSYAELHRLLDSYGLYIEQNITAMTKRIIPHTAAGTKLLIKTASNKYKHKYAEVYWQVKAVEEKDGTKKNYLVRIED